MENFIIPREKYKLYLAILDEYEKLRGLSSEEKEALLDDILSRPYLDLLSDWAFKHVFGHSEENLLLLLNDILPERIASVSYDPNEIDRRKSGDRNVIMDVLCHTDSGQKIIVEMQKADKAHIRNRLFFYGASMVRSQLRDGDSYGELLPVYVICFMNFRLKHDSNQLIYRYMMRDERGECYGSQLSVYLCELPRLVNKSRKDMTPVEKWFDILQNMRTFAHKPEELGPRFDPIFEASRQSPISDTELQQYIRSMIEDKNRSYLTDEDRREIAEEFYAKGIEKGFEKGRKEGIEQGIEQGIAQGIEQGKLAIARKMLDAGMSKADVAKLTGLDLKQIESI